MKADKYRRCLNDPSGEGGGAFVLPILETWGGTALLMSLALLMGEAGVSS